MQSVLTTKDEVIWCYLTVCGTPIFTFACKKQILGFNITLSWGRIKWLPKLRILFAYPLRAPHVPPGVRVPPFENHCHRICTELLQLNLAHLLLCSCTQFVTGHCTTVLYISQYCTLAHKDILHIAATCGHVNVNIAHHYIVVLHKSVLPNYNICICLYS